MAYDPIIEQDKRRRRLGVGGAQMNDGTAVLKNDDWRTGRDPAPVLTPIPNALPNASRDVRLYEQGTYTPPMSESPDAATVRAQKFRRDAAIAGRPIPTESLAPNANPALGPVNTPSSLPPTPAAAPTPSPGPSPTPFLERMQRMGLARNLHQQERTGRMAFNQAYRAADVAGMETGYGNLNAVHDAEKTYDAANPSASTTPAQAALGRHQIQQNIAASKARLNAEADQGLASVATTYSPTMPDEAKAPLVDQINRSLATRKRADMLKGPPDWTPTDTAALVDRTGNRAADATAARGVLPESVARAMAPRRAAEAAAAQQRELATATTAGSIAEQKQRGLGMDVAGVQAKTAYAQARGENIGAERGLAQTQAGFDSAVFDKAAQDFVNDTTGRINPDGVIGGPAFTGIDDSLSTLNSFELNGMPQLRRLAEHDPMSAQERAAQILSMLPPPAADGTYQNSALMMPFGGRQKWRAYAARMTTMRAELAALASGAAQRSTQAMRP